MELFCFMHIQKLNQKLPFSALDSSIKIGIAIANPLGQPYPLVLFYYILFC